MPEVVLCPKCRRKSRVPRVLLGRTVKCPRCAAIFTAAADEPNRMRPTSDSCMRDDDDDDDDDGPRRRRRSDREDDDDDDDDGPRRRRRRSDREDDDEEDEPRRRAAPPQAPTDTCGIISVILGGVSLVLTLLGACSAICCFGLTLYAAVPVAVIGGALAFWGRGALRVIGLSLNILALIPATVLTVMLLIGAALPGPLGPPKGANNPRPALPWNNAPRH